MIEGVRQTERISVLDSAIRRRTASVRDAVEWLRLTSTGCETQQIALSMIEEELDELAKQIDDLRWERGDR